ncbi:SCO family protein [Pedomonas mirosovicensis]|uniref:SCO family protein n=1 Tax=Pedomonas mirosovicensis TaxID=2908641 RepID=UPI002167F6D5|nr:SCO family protein [Pedomonas mirosovicensis]MCH8686783.1 SCO family protein [Pedomonas mirosovicensis]
MATTDRLRALRRILWATVVVVLAALGGMLAWQKFHAPMPQETAALVRPAIGGPFALTDTEGRTVTDKTLKGKPFAIFFGFTRCPDVCPTTLNDLSLLHKQLGPDGNRLNIVFVSVDPEQDKPEDIKQYLTLFDAPIIGLTGTDEQLKTIARAYRVFFEKVPQGSDDYTIDHTATVFLMDADGNFAGTIDMHEPREVALRKLQRLVSRSS